MKHTSVAIIGTGAFASDMCQILAQILEPDVSIAIVGRSQASVQAATSRIRTRISGAAVKPVLADFTDPRQLRRALAILTPQIVVQCASYQSPERPPGPWNDLITTGGFGLTLPLQSVLASLTAAVCADLSTSPTFINACFPDAVNTAITALGHPVLCGLGNVSSLAEVAREQFGYEDQGRVAILAHHAHLKTPPRPEDDVQAWLDNSPLLHPSEWLDAARSGSRRALNRRGAEAGARLVRALVNCEDYNGHAPGPRGLPGGYPVSVRHGQMSLRLPADLTAQQAIAFNDRAAIRDGVRVNADGLVTYSPPAIQALRRVWPTAPSEYPVQAMEPMAEHMLKLRDQLIRFSSTS